MFCIQKPLDDFGVHLATFRRKNAVSEAALVRCGRNGVVFAIQFRPAQIDQA
jgi:hypothetical protein